MDSCPTQLSMTTRGPARTSFRKAFAFFGWSCMCWAVGFALAGEQWTNGVEVLVMPDEIISGISGRNLSILKISIAGTFVSGVAAMLYFMQGCVQMVLESTVGNKLGNDVTR